jgi:aminoglycoside phosphotransferase (APT) family kinase protein
MRGIDEARVTQWFVENIAGCQPPLTFTVIAGGHSNLTFKVDDAAGHRYVLRRPPLGHVLASAHDMAREHRLITAVGQTQVPVPVTLGLCTDVSVNDAPFYIMDFVDGVVVDDAPKAEAMTPEARYKLGFDLIEVLANLHAVDVDKVGLGDLAKRDSYVARQLKRWGGQWEQSKTRELPEVEIVRDRLLASIPTQQAVSIAHGDYRLGNCLADPLTGRITAVLDWELCTLGDPLADIAYVGIYWSDERGQSGRLGDATIVGGFPTYAQLLARYEARSGLDLSNIGYYRALSAWRLCIISEGVLARYLHGQMADDDQEAIVNFRDGAEEMAHKALAFLDEPGAA